MLLINRKISKVGSGPPIILVHGVGLDQYMWDPLLEELKKDFTCITYELCGHGRATQIKGNVTLREFGKGLIELIESVKPLRPILLGFSLGAMVVKRFVVDYPNVVDGLIIAHSVFDRDPTQRKAILKRLETVRKLGLAAIVEPAIERWFTELFKQNNPQILEQVRHTLMGNDLDSYLKSYEVFAQGDLELLPMVNKIECSATIITGEYDINSTPFMAYSLARKIEGSTVIILKGLAHGAPIEAPKRFADAIKNATKQW